MREVATTNREGGIAKFGVAGTGVIEAAEAAIVIAVETGAIETGVTVADESQENPYQRLNPAPLRSPHRLRSNRRARGAAASAR